MASWLDFVKHSLSLFHGKKNHLRVAVAGGHGEYLKVLIKRHRWDGSDLNKPNPAHRNSECIENEDDVKESNSDDDVEASQDKKVRRNAKQYRDVPTKTIAKFIPRTYPPLYIALKLGHYNVAKILLQHGANPDGTHPGASLGIASRNYEMFELLLAFGATMQTDTRLHTELFKAIKYNQVPLVRKLLDMQLLSTKIHYLCLRYALCRGRREIVKIFIEEHGVDLTKTTRALWAAAAGALLEYIQKCMSLGMTETNVNYHPFIAACREGHIEMLAHLTDFKNPNIYAKALYAAIHTAQSEPIVKYLLTSPSMTGHLSVLLKQSLSPDYPTAGSIGKYLYKALSRYHGALAGYLTGPYGYLTKEDYLVSMTNRKRIIQLLLDAGFSPNHICSRDKFMDQKLPAFFSVLANKHVPYEGADVPEFAPYEIELIELMSAYGANFESMDGCFLFKCMTRGSLQIMQHAIKVLHLDPYRTVGEDHDYRTGETVLHFIVRDTPDAIACVQYLLDNFELDINAQSQTYGEHTPLIKCADLPNVMQFLLSRGADPGTHHPRGSLLYHVVSNNKLSTPAHIMKLLDIVLSLPCAQDLVIQGTRPPLGDYYPQKGKHKQMEHDRDNNIQLPLHVVVRTSCEFRLESYVQELQLIKIAMRLLAAGHCKQQLRTRDFTALTPAAIAQERNLQRLYQALQWAEEDPTYPERLLLGNAPYPRTP